KFHSHQLWPSVECADRARGRRPGAPGQPDGRPDQRAHHLQSADNVMKTIQGFTLIRPEDLHWRPSNLMRIPNADYLERTGSVNIGARLWRLPPKSASTLHKHIRAEEFYYVLEGTGRMRVGGET